MKESLEVSKWGKFESFKMGKVWKFQNEEGLEVSKWGKFGSFKMGKLNKWSSTCACVVIKIHTTQCLSQHAYLFKNSPKS